MNILETSICLGLTVNSTLNASPITYRRGNQSMVIEDAQKAQQPHRVNTNDVFGLTLIPNDWIVLASYFTDLGLPKVGDVITEADGSKNRVSETGNGEPCWRYHTGSGKQYIRIHTESIP